MTTGRINQIAILRATAKDDRRLHFHHRQTRDVHKVTPPGHRRREVSGIRNCGPRKRIRKALQNEVTQSLPRGSPPSSTHCTLRYNPLFQPWRPSQQVPHRRQNVSSATSTLRCRHPHTGREGSQNGPQHGRTPHARPPARPQVK